MATRLSVPDRVSARIPPEKTKRAGANPPTAPALSALLIAERDSRNRFPDFGDLRHRLHTADQKTETSPEKSGGLFAHLGTAFGRGLHRFVNGCTKSLVLENGQSCEGRAVR